MPHLVALNDIDRLSVSLSDESGSKEAVIRTDKSTYCTTLAKIFYRVIPNEFILWVDVQSIQHRPILISEVKYRSSVKLKFSSLLGQLSLHNASSVYSLLPCGKSESGQQCGEYPTQMDRQIFWPADGMAEKSTESVICRLDAFPLINWFFGAAVCVIGIFGVLSLDILRLSYWHCP